MAVTRGQRRCRERLPGGKKPLSYRLPGGHQHGYPGMPSEVLTRERHSGADRWALPGRLAVDLRVVAVAIVDLVQIGDVMVGGRPRVATSP